MSEKWFLNYDGSVESFKQLYECKKGDFETDVKWHQEWLKLYGSETPSQAALDELRHDFGNNDAVLNAEYRRRHKDAHDNQEWLDRYASVDDMPIIKWARKAKPGDWCIDSAKSTIVCVSRPTEDINDS